MSSVDRAYDAIRRMAIDFELKPGERLNESELAGRLETSRTPLREALNRLSMEGFLVRDGKRGFRCRSLDAKQVFDLYELRGAIEAAAARIACQRAEDSGLAQLDDLCETDEDIIESLPNSTLIDRDEAFHEALVGASGNDEMVRSLKLVNSQIRFIRGLDRETKHLRSESEHRDIARAMIARDADQAADLLASHIYRRKDEILEVIRRGFLRIYMDDRNAATTG